MTTLVNAEKVRKSFGSTVAVDGVDLSVESGEIVGLLGANGAGKTTLMRCLLGTLAPSSGHTRLFGEPPSRATRARLGYVPQGQGLYADLTVAENAEFMATAYGLAAPATGDNRLVARLPLGEKRRIAFELALAHRPELLILDEPTSGVGVTEAARLWDVIGAETKRGVGVLVTTHNMAEAAQCDRLVVLVDGAVAAAGNNEEVLADSKVVTVDTLEWRSALAAATAAGLRVALAGRRVRVVSDDLALVRLALAGQNVTTRLVPATLDERLVMLAARPS